jgi:hypothetical protein
MIQIIFRDCNLKIWWDGGHAIECETKHATQIQQVRIVQSWILSRSRSEGAVLNLWNLQDGLHLGRFEVINFLDN